MTFSSIHDVQLHPGPPSCKKCDNCGKGPFSRLHVHKRFCANSQDDGTSTNSLQQSKCHGTCPICQRRGFKRLDVHLRFCKKKEVLHAQSVGESSHSDALQTPPSDCIPSSALLPDTSDSLSQKLVSLSVDSNATGPPLCVSESQSAHVDSQCSAPLLLRVRLPTSDDEWLKANTFFASFVVPLVKSTQSVHVKYSVLRHGIYNYFANCFGTIHKKSKRKLCSSIRCSRDARKCKRAAKHELKKAIRLEMPAEDTRALSRKWYCTIRDHNKAIR